MSKVVIIDRRGCLHTGEGMVRFQRNHKSPGCHELRRNTQLFG